MILKKNELLHGLQMFSYQFVRSKQGICTIFLAPFEVGDLLMHCTVTIQLRDRSWNLLHCLLLKRVKESCKTGSITIPWLDLPWMIWILLTLLVRDLPATLCCILLMV